MSWKPHFIVSREGGLIVCQIHEVYYDEEMNITAWTSNQCNPDWTSLLRRGSDVNQTMQDCVDEAKLLLDIYATASQNVVYQEVTNESGFSELIEFEGV